MLAGVDVVGGAAQQADLLAARQRLEVRGKLAGPDAGGLGEQHGGGVLGRGAVVGAVAREQEADQAVVGGHRFELAGHGGEGVGGVLVGDVRDRAGTGGIGGAIDLLDIDRLPPRGTADGDEGVWSARVRAVAGFDLQYLGRIR